MQPDTKQAELRSARNAPDDDLISRFEGYELDRAQWQLRWNGQPLTIARKPFDLLAYLIANRNRVVTKDELLEQLWPEQFVDENNLAQQISFLRKTLSKHNPSKKLIETVAGRGYRFVAPLEELPGTTDDTHHYVSAEQSFARITVEEELDTASDATSQPTRAPLPFFSGGRPRLRLVTTGIAVVALGFASYAGWHWWQNRQTGEPVQVVLTPVEGSTGDAVLDRALNNTARFDLIQSPFITVVPAGEVGSTLQQMKRNANDPLTADLAREVCERTGSQAVVHMLLARDGSHFLLTGEAVGCVNGNTLAAVTREAKRADDLPLALNKLTENLRKQLGESRGSIARFTTPASALETMSLDAWRASTQAGVLHNQGKFAEAVAMQKQAIAFDPKFASAYLDLATAYQSLEDHANATAAMVRANELRNTVSPFLQMAIAARYDELVTGDLYAAERDASLWTQLYPKFATAWTYLSVDRAHLGDHAGAVEAIKKIVSIRHDLSTFYANLCQEQMHAGDFQASLDSCRHGVAVNPDDEFFHLTLAQLAFAKGDRNSSEAESDWLAKHPKSPLMAAAEAEMAIAQGRFTQARRLAAQSVEVYREQGSPASALEITNMMASEFFGADDEEDGRALLSKDQIDQDAEEYGLIALVQTGDGGTAEDLLQAELAKHPQDTLWNESRAPEVRGWIALRVNRPEDALKALNQTGVLDTRDATVHFLRGNAYLATVQLQKAESEFRWVVNHPGLDHSFAHSQSWLGLGRVLAAEGNKPAAKDAYRHFLNLWATADPGAVLLQQARMELTRLN